MELWFPGWFGSGPSKKLASNLVEGAWDPANRQVMSGNTEARRVSIQHSDDASIDTDDDSSMDSNVMVDSVSKLDMDSVRWKYLRTDRPQERLKDGLQHLDEAGLQEMRLDEGGSNHRLGAEEAPVAGPSSLRSSGCLLSCVFDPDMGLVEPEELDGGRQNGEREEEKRGLGFRGKTERKLRRKQYSPYTAESSWEFELNRASSSRYPDSHPHPHPRSHWRSASLPDQRPPSTSRLGSRSSCHLDKSEGVEEMYTHQGSSVPEDISRDMNGLELHDVEQNSEQARSESQTRIGSQTRIPSNNSHSRAKRKGKRPRGDPAIPNFLKKGPGRLPER